MDINQKARKGIGGITDIDEALKRYAATSPRWRTAWASAIEKLAPNEYKSDGKSLYRRIAPGIFCDVNIVDPTGMANKCYLIKCLNSAGTLIFSKIGTTQRAITKRMREHLKNYRKFDVAIILIQRIWDCAQRAAEGLESLFRAKYIKEVPQNFRKNDRFINFTFNLKQADRMAAAYLKE